MNNKISRRAVLGIGATGGLTAGLGLTMGSLVLSSPARAEGPAKVGLLIPQSGPAALFGPSSKNCADLAVEEINARGGLNGRKIELVVRDAGVAPAEASQTALKMWKGDGVEAFVGMHDSAVRGALVSLFKGQVPYIYTPTYEGGECGAGTFVLGETPMQQLEPVVPWLAKERSLKRWYLIGNDYNWPRDTNTTAKKYIAATGGSVVGEDYLPFTVDNFDANLAKIRESKADAVLITLVGGASVGFNRAFASFGMADKVLRLGTLIEENTLTGIGAQNSRNLFSSAGYFAGLQTAQAVGLEKRYAGKFGDKAPVMNALAESCYEGMLLLESMAKNAGSLQVKKIESIADGLRYDGPRGRTVMHNRHATKDIFLARAEGATFKIVQSFKQIGAGQSCK